MKWGEGLLGGEGGREAGHGHLLGLVLGGHRGGGRGGAQLGELAAAHLLHPPDAEQQPLLVAELVEADVLQVLDGDAEDVLDLRVPLGEERGGVLGQVQ